MPLPIATLDDRTYQDLLDEARARIPVHNPEWTNFNKSDPGITLLELFAFLTENLLYRCNQIPDRNRLKFLNLLGVPLQPAWSARGLVTITNDRGPLQTITLNDAIEVRAGQVPFRTEQGLDILPIEAQVYYKSPAPALTTDQAAAYAQLYASYLQGARTPQLSYYETVPLTGTGGIDLGQDTVDGAVWIALLLRAADKPSSASARDLDDRKNQVRQQLAGRTLSLGLVPFLAGAGRHLTPGDNQAGVLNQKLLQFQLPSLPPGGILPSDPSQRLARYRSLPAVFPSQSVLSQPGAVQISLPDDSAALELWQNLEPLEAGAGDFPPALDDTNLNDRLLTWLRISSRDPQTNQPVKVRIGLLWAGVNVTTVSQRAHVVNELLPAGTGEPDQSVTLAQAPVLPDSVHVTVQANGQAKEWLEVPDLTLAGPEIPTPDPRQPPGTTSVVNPNSKVFAVDPVSGQIRFGDGMRGARPPLNAVLRASYDYGVGSAGNVGPAAIDSSPALPAGLKVTNPVPTWGGADAETVAEAEKQIPSYLRHRDRLVNADDFATITRRTPGADVGRVDVIPAYNPELAGSEPGDAPGAVTLMIIPRSDPLHPDTPEPDQPFLDTVCDYLDPRRLVTTELFLRGPTYKTIWISVGIQVAGGLSPGPVCAAVQQALHDFLSPLPASTDATYTADLLLVAPSTGGPGQGWPRTKPVVALELLAVASRVSGVQFVQDVQVTQDGINPAAQIDMQGLELPRVAAITVVPGDPVPVSQLTGQGPVRQPPPLLPVPVIPEEC